MIQPIRNDEAKANENLVQVAEKVTGARRRVRRALLNGATMFVGVFLIFVVVVVFTTEISFNDFLTWAAFGLAFAILLFCSYSMFVNFYSSGMRAGRSTAAYAEAYDKYEELKQGIIKSKIQGRLMEFCRYFVKEELNTARNTVLTEVGLSLEVYNNRYVGKDVETLKKDKDLSKAQVAAIIRANKTKPIHLSPEMILRRGRGGFSRSPLGIKPEVRRGVTFGNKFIQTLIVSGITGVIVLEVIVDPTWATFAACLLRLMPVILNGFVGYRMGYENITIDSVSYISDQSDLIEQFLQFVETNPELPPPEDIAGDGRLKVIETI